METETAIAPHMTADEFRCIQRDLAITDRALADNLGLSRTNGHMTVRRFKRGQLAVSGPVAAAMLAFRDGFRPPWWSDVHRPL